MRYRDWFIIAGSVSVLMSLIITDPGLGLIGKLGVGSGTLGLVINIGIAIWLVAFMHFARKSLSDYVDEEEYHKVAIQTPEGAGLALIATGLKWIAIALCIQAAMK